MVKIEQALKQEKWEIQSFVNTGKNYEKREQKAS